MISGKLRVAVLTALITVGLWPAHSAAISFNLNCIVTGNDTCTSSVTYGTISFTDNAGDSNAVDVRVDLVGTGQRIQNAFFNYNDAIFQNNAFSISPESVGVSENGSTLSPLNSLGFDLQIPNPPPPNMNTPDPYVGTLTLAGFNLNPEHFNFKDSTGTLFAAVHIGTCGPNGPASCLPGETGNNSIKVGALGDPLTPVPEPATLLLWGTTVVGLGFLKRRRHRARD
jgi:hypothetical protein